MIRKYLFTTVITAAILCGYSKAGAQGMAVNTTGTTANSSAILDVSSTTQGMLVPRIAGTSSVTSPAQGLLIYNTTTNQFNYYNGSAWVAINTPGGTAGGDLTGSYPNPTISSAAGNDIVTAMNASTGGLSGTKLATNSVSVNALSATGTASSTTFLRGDNSWQTVSAGSSLSAGTTGGQVYLTGAGGTVPTTPVSVSGDATLASTGALALATSGVTAGTYGSSTQSVQFSVDAKGRITNISNQTISGGTAFGTIGNSGTAVSNSPTSPTLIPAADQVYRFVLPSSGVAYLQLPTAASFTKGYTIYIYPSTSVATTYSFNLGPAPSDLLWFRTNHSVPYGTSAASNFCCSFWFYDRKTAIVRTMKKTFIIWQSFPIFFSAFYDAVFSRVIKNYYPAQFSQ